MSSIRFVHTDFLRLGTSVSGLAESPSWLRQLATGAVRQAVRNVIDLAVSQRAGFVLIAGGIVDAGTNPEPALRWLNEQFETLRSHGISVVTTADDSETRAAFSNVFDVVLHPRESLQVTRHASGIVLNKVSQTHRAPGDLLINVGSHNLLANDSFVYQARPSLDASANCSQVSRDSYLSLSAGAVQSVSQDETQDRGCIIVDADFGKQELRSQFHACDVLRYRTETITLPGVTAPQSLVSEIVQACESVDRAATQTVVIDWVLQAEFATELAAVEELNENRLLSRLRERLHSGHRGIWPRRITFDESSRLRLASAPTAAVDEYSNQVAEGVHYRSAHTHGSQLSSIQDGTFVKPDLLCGLTFLSRVA